MPRADRRSLWLLFAITLIGAAIRFTTVDRQSFSTDEAATWAIISHGFGHVWSAVINHESTPPLYYVLAWLWSRVFGTGEAGLRSLSALCGTATIPVMWAAGRRLASGRVGLMAALLTAINPLLFWYSQEARAYSLMVLLSALSLLAMSWALQRATGLRLLAWGLTGALALTSHYFAAFAVVPEAIALLVLLGRRGSLNDDRVVLALTPVVVVGIALGVLARHQSHANASFATAATGSLAVRLARLVRQDALGLGQPLEVLLVVVGALVIAGALALLIARASGRERDGGLLALGIGAGGVALALVVAAIWTDYFDTRNLLATWPALTLAVAAGLAAAPAGRLVAVGLGGLAILGLVCIANVILDPDFQRDDWRGAVRAIGPVGQPRAIVSGVAGVPALQPYLRSASPYPATGTPIREVDVIWLVRPSYGQPLEPLSPASLPGFSLHEIRTSSYVVLRYRASSPATVPPPALARLYPASGQGLAQLQAP